MASGTGTVKRQRGAAGERVPAAGDTAASRMRGGQRGGFDPLTAQQSPATGTAYCANGKRHYRTR